MSGVANAVSQVTMAAKASDAAAAAEYFGGNRMESLWSMLKTGYQGQFIV